MSVSIKRRLFAAGLAVVLPISGTALAAPQAVAETVIGGCFGSTPDRPNFEGDSFLELSDFLSAKFQKNGRVWQAQDDQAVSDAWCSLNGNRASVANADGQISADPSERTLGDGTKLSFRGTSKSGGYTIDINSPDRTKNFKVHVAK
ncbi:hypothetical protein [Corynebacterium oculi]|uniref:hypothetical protein n=1 Tax=Corynebacterium oculi TaxID=1544416 RepID=UPI0012376A01|nr:hypothetical protein [Corynebacterium oculi]